MATPQPAVTVEWLDLPAWTVSPCPCGWDNPLPLPSERRLHERKHLAWSAGVRADPAMPLGSIVVTGTSPIAWRRVAYELGRLFQREEGYDVPPLPDEWLWPRIQPKTVAVLLVTSSRRAIALAVVDGVATDWWTYDLARKERGERGDRPIPVLSAIFVCHAWRGRGLGQEVARAAAEHVRTSPAEMAWLAPLTEGGRRLARRLCGDRVRLC
jgi:GNAT superfamily N-acetyltransferase